MTPIQQPSTSQYTRRGIQMKCPHCVQAIWFSRVPQDRRHCAACFEEFHHLARMISPPIWSFVCGSGPSSFRRSSRSRSPMLRLRGFSLLYSSS